MTPPPSEQDYADLAVLALLRGLERTGHASAVLRELTPLEQQAVFQAEARALDSVRPRAAASDASGDHEPTTAIAAFPPLQVTLENRASAGADSSTPVGTRTRRPHR
jgi:hypothetical protein